MTERIASPGESPNDAPKRTKLARRRAMMNEVLKLSKKDRQDRILAELRQRERADPGQGPHESTARWQELCGQVIPGETIAAQASAVAHLDAETRGDPRVVHEVMFGNREPSAIAQAVGASPASPAWPQRLATAITAFNDCTWPLDLMGSG